MRKILLTAAGLTGPICPSGVTYMRACTVINSDATLRDKQKAVRMADGIPEKHSISDTLTECLYAKQRTHVSSASSGLPRLFRQHFDGYNLILLSLILGCCSNSATFCTPL